MEDIKYKKEMEREERRLLAALGILVAVLLFAVMIFMLDIP